MGIGRSHEETIVAIASPHGPGIRGVIRLSGPEAVHLATENFQPDTGCFSTESLTPSATDGSLVCDEFRIPGCLLVWPTAKSFTRQPSAEFHTFGSNSILELAVAEFCRLGARMARPGEFTMRAFLSGRLDLTQAEAVLAVIDAKDKKQLNVAIDQLAGGMGSRLTAIRNELVAALAELEAGLDFVEEDIEFISATVMLDKLRAALGSLEQLLSQIQSRSSSNAMYRVSLFGLPNAGKSSLFNCLANRDIAIVSDVQGTTTDRVSSVLNLAGLSIELVDTAGLESVELTGTIASASQIHRSEEIRQCDTALLCIDVNQGEQQIREQLNQFTEFEDALPIVVLTQIDRIDADRLQTLVELVSAHVGSDAIVPTSSARGAGIEVLKDRIRSHAIASQSAESSVVGSTVIRTQQSLKEARDAVQSAIEVAIAEIGDEVIASEVRSALDCIGVIVGTIYTDDILDVVFGKFCIGK